MSEAWRSCEQLGAPGVPQALELGSRVSGTLGWHEAQRNRAFGVAVGLQAACLWEWRERSNHGNAEPWGSGRLSPANGVGVTSAALLPSLFSTAGPCF